MMREEALNRHQNKKVSLRNRERKNQKLRLIPLKLRPTRGKNLKNGQVVI